MWDGGGFQHDILALSASTDVHRGLKVQDCDPTKAIGNQANLSQLGQSLVQNCNSGTRFPGERHAEQVARFDRTRLHRQLVFEQYDSAFDLGGKETADV